MNLRRVKALVKKEISQIYKDPSSLMTAVVFPLILLFLYGFGVSLDMDNIRLGVVSEDSGPLARGFVRSLMTTRYLKTNVVKDRKEAEKLLTSGRFDGVVVIPSYFSQYINNRNQTAPIQVIAEGSEPNTAQFVQNYVRGVWLTWQQNQALENGIGRKALINVVPRIWYNEELRSNYFLIPGSIVIIITVTGAFLTSLVIAREWERGTMEALMSTPVSMSEIVLSKLATYFMLGIASMALCFFVAHYLYGIPFRGSYFGLVLTSVSYLLFALGMGLFISISVRDQFAASQIAIVSTYLPAFILSGFIFDIASMPLYLRVLTHFVPAKYFVDSLKTQFLVGDIWSILLPNILIMNVFTLFIFFLMKQKNHKRLD
ncbi:Inner membrane transport permease ybhS [Waddlia chondrophila 2032/99]|uniref:Inner membrane transport permease ybhS n=1 Tax=Waddlia chondrophila 2032/99 TaxID=765953 RepID=F8LFA5_9BACT|nr:Inner membrane transport permease ybhS [Waddlia chondrophila 2032/99]